MVNDTMENYWLKTTCLLLSFGLFFLMGFGLGAQENPFQNVSGDHGISFLYGNTQFGNGMSFYDFDQDGWDDLTLSQPTYGTTIYKNNEGNFSPIAQIPSGLDTKSVLWFDMNNDGFMDLLTSSKDQGIKLFRNINNWSFENVSFGLNSPELSSHQIWGLACSDINRDGLLDIYACNYNTSHSNLTFINQGNFVFTLINQYFSPDFLRNSFQASFVPLNDDAIPDLYVINDFLQGNNIYMSESDSTFTDLATINGLDIPSDAMSNSWSDFDRDGDWDVYITNRSEGNRLMLNYGNAIFNDESVARNCTINQWCWSGLWVDFDNDGWEDLWVTNEHPAYNSVNVGNHLLQNNNGQFNEIPLISFENIDGYTSAKGDFNRDGHYDIAYQPKENNSFQLLENNISTPYHHMNITLHGVYSNRQAIGSIVQYYHQGELAQTLLQMGENYLNQNSQHLILGLGLDTLVDSLIIRWPSGIIDRHYEVSSGERYDFYEGETIPLYSLSMVDSCAPENGYWIQFQPDFNIFPQDSEIQNLGNNSYWIPTHGDWNFLCGRFDAITLPINLQIAAPYVPVWSTTMPSCANSENGAITWYSPEGTWNNDMDSLGVGQYVVEIQKGQCIWNDTLILTPQETITIDSILIQPALCENLNNGSVTPYYTSNAPSVTWSIEDSLINGQLSSGNYAITFTTSLGCQIQNWVAVPNQIQLPTFDTSNVKICAEEHLELENFNAHWAQDGWELTQWESNETEDSIFIHYLHPNGCAVAHGWPLEWITAPTPIVDALPIEGGNVVACSVSNADSLVFEIDWEDGSMDWLNNIPCNDSTYFVLEYHNYCAWTFPIYSACIETLITEKKDKDGVWTYCGGLLSSDIDFSGETTVYNAMGQTIHRGQTGGIISIEKALLPRWVKNLGKIYPIQWCAEE